MSNDKSIRSYRDLDVWHVSITLAELCYLETKQFPRDELFGMIAQIRRSAAAIPANIAEGYGRETPGAFIQSLRIAQGSLKELETHIILSQRVALLLPEPADRLLAECDRVGRMLRNFIRSLQAKE
jgi:four helix bundle protein